MEGVVVGMDVEPRLCEGLEEAKVDMFQLRREQKGLFGTGDGEQ